jgi:hypothetical protein
MAFYYDVLGTEKFDITIDRNFRGSGESEQEVLVVLKMGGENRLYSFCWLFIEKRQKVLMGHGFRTSWPVKPQQAPRSLKHKYTAVYNIPHLGAK